jgi:uncharacterized membrane protein HdeD (DUF308 family)
MAELNVASRAEAVSRIFRTLATVVVVVGALFILGGLITWLSVLFDRGFGDAWPALFAVLGAVVYTAVAWAGVTLSSVVAGYIALKSPDRPV